MIGRVVSTKVKNTAVVLVERKATHRLYKKSFIRSKKYLVEDPKGVKDGDIVEIEKIRPISKRKHWMVMKVLGRSFAEIAEEQMKEKAEQAIEEVMPEKEESEQNTPIKSGSTVEGGQLEAKVEVKEEKKGAKKVSRTKAQTGQSVRKTK